MQFITSMDAFGEMLLELFVLRFLTTQPATQIRRQPGETVA